MDKQSNSYSSLKQKLEQRNRAIKEKLVQKHAEAFKWISNDTKQLVAGAVGSFLLLTSPTTGLLASSHAVAVKEKFLDVPDNLFVVNDLKPYLPEQVGGLISGQEEEIAGVLSSHYGFKVTPEINGLRLKDTYGYIGAEQHLMRYPGDNIEEHFDNSNDAATFTSSGMAPGRGAFGYFAPSKNALTKKDSDREKYYIAVQTFMAKDYSTRSGEYVDFFKFRKMLVVNPENGKAVVCDIADSGPAIWTGKQLGGSPEVMKYLERVDGSLKGPVLYFFIDDPTDSIPLGPVQPKELEMES
jgi:hypothetical protein